jgi:Fic family protein
VIKYERPRSFILYSLPDVASALVEAKSAALSLRTIPYQRSWVETLQQIQLKREVAGTSRIEGAEFTERELEAAIRETPEQLLTRSQRQAHAAVGTYRWLATVPDDRPVNQQLLLEIHRRIVTGADDDHCPPGKLRGRDENVLFGIPRHRGVEGGAECEATLAALAQALQHEYREHDPLIQALAAHYHIAAMHPFLDGNGRTARALEALLLQRAGLRDSCFVAMSNYYYDEKDAYLATLARTRAGGHDLTPFLVFALKGVAVQSRRLLGEIQHHLAKGLYRNLMYDLFNRLRSPRKRVIAERQITILKVLLDSGRLELEARLDNVTSEYAQLKNSRKAMVRDIGDLRALGAIAVEHGESGQVYMDVRLQWPTEITETKFFERLKALPKSKTHPFLP